MPGHVKAGGSNEPDPDATPYLFVSFEIKKEDSLKPYDTQKSVWVSWCMPLNNLTLLLSSVFNAFSNGVPY